MALSVSVRDGFGKHTRIYSDGHISLEAFLQTKPIYECNTLTLWRGLISITSGRPDYQIFLSTLAAASEGKSLRGGAFSTCPIDGQQGIENQARTRMRCPSSLWTLLYQDLTTIHLDDYEADLATWIALPTGDYLSTGVNSLDLKKLQDRPHSLAQALFAPR